MTQTQMGTQCANTRPRETDCEGVNLMQGYYTMDPADQSDGEVVGGSTTPLDDWIMGCEDSPQGDIDDAMVPEPPVDPRRQSGPMPELKRELMFRTKTARCSSPKKADWAIEYGANVRAECGELVMETMTGDYVIARMDNIFHPGFRAFFQEHAAKDLLLLLEDGGTVRVSSDALTVVAEVGTARFTGRYKRSLPRVDGGMYLVFTDRTSDDLVMMRSGRIKDETQAKRRSDIPGPNCLGCVAIPREVCHAG